MIIRSFCAGLLALLLLTGCSRVPEYVTLRDMPDQNQPGHGKGGTESLTEGEGIPEDLAGYEGISEKAGLSGGRERYGTAGSSDSAGNERMGTAGRNAGGRYGSGKTADDTDGGPALEAYTDGAHLLVPGWKLTKAMDLRVPEHTLGLLKGRLALLLDGYEGAWSLAARDLQTGERIVIQDIPMPSASVMKLFILGCLYEEFRTGRLARTEELVQRMYDMTRASSNTAANEIIRILGEGDYADGIRYINEYIRGSGYSQETVIHNPFQEESLILDPDHHNQTTADDTAEILERIYRRSFGTRYACNETEQLLLESEMKYKLPSVLPDGVSAANKTGETDEVENDAAIIFTPKGDYILTVFSCDWNDKSLAQQHFKEISAEAYRYFSSDDYGRKLYPYLKPAKEPEEEHGPLQVPLQEPEQETEQESEQEPEQESEQGSEQEAEQVSEQVSEQEPER